MGSKRDGGDFMFITILFAALGLSILIISHELGHFLVAKRSGINVPEFSIGFGPRLFGWKKGGTNYSIRLIIFGGYIKMAGEEEKSAEGKEGEFLSKPPGVRARVIFWGPLSNLILAVLLYSFINLFFGIGVIDTTIIKSAPLDAGLIEGDRILAINGRAVSDWWDVRRGLGRHKENALKIERKSDVLEICVPSSYNDSIIPVILSVLGDVGRGSPACRAGLMRKDRIIEVDGHKVEYWEDMVGIIQKGANDTLDFVFLRGGNTLTTSVLIEEKETLIDGKPGKAGVIGVAVYTKRRRLGLYSFYQGVKDLSFTVYYTVYFLKQLILRQISPKYLGGPVSIVRIAGESLSWGISSYISFLAFLSCQLGILNLIPFPPLDGGHLIVILIEKIMRRRPSEKLISAVQMVGFALLIMFMLYITMNDILRIFSP